MIKISAWLRRWSVPGMWVSGALTLIALVLSRSAAPEILPAACFITAFILCGLPVLWQAVQALKYKTVSIELLVSIAAIGACFIGEFSESAIVCFLFRFGSYLEQKTMKKTRSAIKALTEMAPSTALKINDLQEDGTREIEEIDADEVEIGDILLVRTGSQIAADGVVVKGEAFVTEAGITGEPMAKRKLPGDVLYAGTIAESGTLEMRATKVGEDTVFSKIIALVEEAQDAKSPAERFIDRFAKYYTPAVIVLAALVLLFTRSVETAITVLVLACPGALVIGAPIANVAGIGRGAQEGILLKGGDSVHTFSKTDTVVFDKTGTLTEGFPQVSVQKNYSENPELTLALAASAEQASDHPLANAIVRYAKGSAVYEAESAETIKGRGIEALVKGHRVLAGSRKLMEECGIALPETVLRDLSELQSGGASCVLVAVDGKIEMLLGISDRQRPDAEESLARLKSMGISRLIMLTGDNHATAEAVCASLGITEFRAELLPEDKLCVIRELQSEGKTVTFVGDGINDSPALAAADTGIAMGSGTDVAIDNSDVVLIKSDLSSLVRALSLSRATVRVMYQNIAVAVGTVLLLIVGLFAGYVHMSIGMLIHEASILAVIFNAMRLLIPKRKVKETNS